MKIARYNRKTYREGWKLYRDAMLSHHAQGASAAGMILWMEVQWQFFGMIWAILYISYQALSVLRKQDSAGLDVLDFMVGAGLTASIIGLIEAAVWLSS